MTDNFRNASDLEFKSLASEKYRTYIFQDGSKATIDFPLWLHVSASGGHRIFDDAGVCHYIPAGWIHLVWEVKEGAAHFDF